MYFAPMKWFTVLTLMMLAILLTLGTWQYQRLQWKTDLLADIDAAAEAAPFTSLSDVNRAIKDGDPVDFRRVGTPAIYFSDAGAATEFHVFTTRDKQTAWRIYRLALAEGGHRVFIAAETVNDAEKDFPRKVEDNGKGQIITGYIRLRQDPSFGSPKSTPSLNRYFSFNPVPDEYDWASAYAVPTQRIISDYYIDAVPAKSATDLPPKKPDIRNNHFDYMLTWYSFAVILLIIYIIMHMRAGRLRFGGRS